MPAKKVDVIVVGAGASGGDRSIGTGAERSKSCLL